MIVVAVSGLTRRLRYGGVFDLSFEIRRGERLAIFGDAGAGKTALLALVAGLLEPDQGEVRLFGESPASSSARVGAALQSREVGSASARQAILGSLSAARVAAPQRPARLAEALHISGLYERADQPARELNHTAKRALRIAMATAARPELLLLDDLTRAMPPDQSARWWDYFDQRRREEGMTVVHATMDSAEAEAADRVLVLEQGRDIGCARPDLLINSCHGEEIAIEAADSERVERTLRGIPQVAGISSADGVRFTALDGADVASHLFRHPSGGVRAVFVRRPTLWDYVRQARAHRPPGGPAS